MHRSTAARRWRRGGATAALLLILGGCGFFTGMNGEGPILYDPDYRQALDHYTRQQSLYQGLQRRVIWAATLESLAFRRLRSEAYASLRRLSEAELSMLMEEEARQAEAYLDFFVGFFTERLVWNDLDVPNSIWRVDLLVDGHQILLPVRIERILSPDANIRALYPYVGHFSRAYRIRFLRTDAEGRELFPEDAKELTLRVSSAVAHGTLRWPTSLLHERVHGVNVIEDSLDRDQE